MKLELDYPPVRLNPNRRYKCHRAHNSVFQKYKRDCFLLAGQSKPPSEFRLRVTFHPKTNHARDKDNVISAFKAGQDGLAQAWGVDDSIFDFQYHIGDVVKPHGKVIITEAT